MSRTPPLKREDTRYRPRHPFLAGAITGGVEIMITFPFEFVKVQLQLRHQYALNHFHGPISCALYTIRNKGFPGLYKGLSPWLLFAFPRSAVRFSTYEHVSHYLQGDGLKVEPLYAMLAGTVAGAAEFATVGTPMQCIQIKMAHDAYSASPRFKGTWHATRLIIQEEGVWRGMYGGVGPTVLKGAVNNAVRFSVFNELKHLYEHYMGRDVQGGGMTLHPLESMLMGSTAGALSAVVTHPIDTVKSNMQALNSGGYRNSFDCVRDIVRRQGVLGLYKGLSARFVRVTLEIGLHFTLFERVARQLEEVWP